MYISYSMKNTHHYTPPPSWNKTSATINGNHSGSFKSKPSYTERSYSTCDLITSRRVPELAPLHPTSFDRPRATPRLYNMFKSEKTDDGPVRQISFLSQRLHDVERTRRKDNIIGTPDALSVPG